MNAHTDIARERRAQRIAQAHRDIATLEAVIEAANKLIGVALSDAKDNDFWRTYQGQIGLAQAVADYACVDPDEIGTLYTVATEELLREHRYDFGEGHYVDAFGDPVSEAAE